MSHAAPHVAGADPGLLHVRWRRGRSGVLQLPIPVIGERASPRQSQRSGQRRPGRHLRQLQYGGSGADGIGFVIATEEPADPAAPTQIGEPGGDLGSSAGEGQFGSDGFADGYLGVGLDVFGNYSDPGFGGTRCRASPRGPPAEPRAGGRAGPRQRHGRILPRRQLGQAGGGTQNLHGEIRSGSMVSVEVVLDSASAQVAMGGSQVAAFAMSAVDYGVAGSASAARARSHARHCPACTTGASRAGCTPGAGSARRRGFPASSASVGWGRPESSADCQQISDASVATLRRVPVLSAAISDRGRGQLPSGGSVGSRRAGVTAGGGAENDTVGMTATLASGVPPRSATGTRLTMPSARRARPCPPRIPARDCPQGQTFSPVSSCRAASPAGLAAGAAFWTAPSPSRNDGDVGEEPQITRRWGQPLRRSPR